MGTQWYLYLIGMGFIGYVRPMCQRLYSFYFDSIYISTFMWATGAPFLCRRIHIFFLTVTYTYLCNVMTIEKNVKFIFSRFCFLSSILMGIFVQRLNKETCCHLWFGPNTKAKRLKKNQIYIFLWWWNQILLYNARVRSVLLCYTHTHIASWDIIARVDEAESYWLREKTLRISSFINL